VDSLFFRDANIREGNKQILISFDYFFSDTKYFFSLLRKRHIF